MSQERPFRQVLGAIQAVADVADALSAPRPATGLATSFALSLERLLQTDQRTADESSAWASLLPDTARRAIARAAPGAQSRALASRAEMRIRQWQVAVIEMLDRLTHDWRDIVQTFDIDPAATLASVSPPLGDRHNHGRQVCRLDFGDGRSVIYKPRPVWTEQTFGRVLGFLGERGAKPTLSSIRTLGRDEYGWTEYIRQSPSRDRHEATEFYWRQGGAMSLLWMLGAYDTLTENVVVHRAQPMWIDLECICRPDIPRASTLTAAMPSWIARSALSTGMILYGKQPGAPDRQSSGLSVSCARNRSDVFTDDDVLKAPYLNAVLQGFRDIYTWLLAHRDVLAADDGPLDWWRDLPVRVVFRTTMSYEAMVRLWMMTPPDLMDDVRHDLRAVLRSLEGDDYGVCPLWPPEMVDADLASIERGDIPYWTTTTQAYDVREAAGPCVTSLISRTGMTCLAERMAEMSADDLSRQLWLIESFLGRPVGVAR